MVTEEVIDTHLHLWDPARFNYSWMKGFDVLNRKHMVEDYAAAAAGTGIEAAVYVDTDVDGEDLEAERDFIFQLAEEPANRIAGIVAGAKLENRNGLETLRAYFDHPKLKGVRRVLHTQPDALPEAPDFVANVRSLADADLSFDLCVQARQLPLALGLVRKCPEVAFILDHCGNPGIKDRQRHPWQEHIRELAAEPNVACKVSGLVTQADPLRGSADDLRPYFEWVVECFGWSRVMWGSDWPVCNLATGMKEWLGVARALTAGAANEERQRFFSGNARRIYRLS